MRVYYRGQSTTVHKLQESAGSIPREDAKVARLTCEALSSGGAHLRLSAGLCLIADGETRLFPGVSQPRGSSAFGLGELLRRHCQADVFLAFLDLFEHRGRLLFCEQVPHVCGNGGGLEARDLSIFVVLNIFDLTKMLGQAKLCTGVAGLGGFDDRRECVALSVAVACWLGLRVVHGQVEQLGAVGDAQLVKNTEKVILDRMRAEAESLSNFAV